MMDIQEIRHNESQELLEAIRDKDATTTVVVPAPQVTVETPTALAPVVNIEPFVVPAPEVHLAGPIINIPEAEPFPEFPPHPMPITWRFTVERDRMGKITGGQIFPDIGGTDGT